ncbi:hypothetical protein FF011L_19440 [Roseimaritima multifibrata]|uniref:Uncharacterized protein n=1 Tax=Roseimaritima multifibrata TaxID=1930274 RepID=A0A517ME69_9BACT|nr:hypothetical protein FF011L_19440 [Roseimaritima multifibrata]
MDKYPPSGSEFVDLGLAPLIGQSAVPLQRSTFAVADSKIPFDLLQIYVTETPCQPRSLLAARITPTSNPRTHLRRNNPIDRAMHEHPKTVPLKYR